ncbi:META domain-containing protein [Arthrobacter cavernae]|uniref:META domain-containing protein n=1 Tax=Arthrobacter cavernae TaxID=2817681 RepID=A0A939HDR3_9MICC|nr:META domain-containing protein [Arthrobacter cavernae]MBO1266523.1 META domain-containing protein [Arthrobacter cavernae]
MVFVNGTWTVGVKTPCNHLGVEVEVNGGTWIPGRRISTAMACLGPESNYETWTHRLFEQPVTWSLEGNSLKLHNAHGSVEFQEAGPIPHM